MTFLTRSRHDIDRMLGKLRRNRITAEMNALPPDQLKERLVKAIIDARLKGNVTVDQIAFGAVPREKIAKHFHECLAIARKREPALFRGGDEC